MELNDFQKKMEASGAGTFSFKVIGEVPHTKIRSYLDGIIMETDTLQDAVDKSFAKREANLKDLLAHAEQNIATSSAAKESLTLAINEQVKIAAQEAEAKALAEAEAQALAEAEAKALADAQALAEAEAQALAEEEAEARRQASAEENQEAPVEASSEAQPEAAPSEETSAEVSSQILAVEEAPAESIDLKNE